METGAIAKAQCWTDFEDVIEAGIKRVILWGLPGTGKTYAGLTHAVGEGGSFRLVCSEEMTNAQVSGTWMPNGERWTFAEGMALKAWRGNGQVGGRLVIDEIDKVSGDVEGELHNFTDSIASASFRNPETDEVITPLDGFSVIATTNLENPEWLKPALRDRFSTAIEINAPHPNALLQLPENLREVANAVISAEPERRVSLRAFYDYQTLLNSGMEIGRSAQLVFGKNRGEAIVEALTIGAL